MTRLFRKPRGSRGLVVLNWHGKSLGEFPYFAEAFHSVARRAVAALRRKRGFGNLPHEDFKAYPIVFLYRHALELAMKTVILEGAELLQRNGDSPVDLNRLLRQHGLQALRQDVERVFRACGWHRGFGVRHFRSIQDFRAVIRDLEELDPHPAVAFRYPVNRRRNPVLPPGFRFDLFWLSEVLDELVPLLINAAWGVREELGAANEHE
jgi:hypothetical protein